MRIGRSRLVMAGMEKRRIAEPFVQNSSPFFTNG